MPHRTRRVGYYVVTLLCVVIVFTLAYNYGMSVFEKSPQPYAHSLVMVVETLTTTGYGEDAPWTSPVMNLLVLGMELSGVVLLLAALPVFVIPLIEDRLATTPPTAVTGIEDHVIVCGYTPLGRSLVSELIPRDVDYVIVESDRDTATYLHETATSVIYGDPELPETFRNANINEASAVLTDASDEINASIILAVREAGDDVHVVSMVDEPSLSEYQTYAGADRVLSPRQLLGKGLANRARSVNSSNLNEIIDLHESFEIAEFPLGPDSDVLGQTLATSRLGQRSGVGVIGGWQRGAFVSPISPDAVLDEYTRLLVVGRPAQLARLEEIVQSRMRQQQREPIVVVGMGEVGRTVAAILAAADLPVIRVGPADEPDVDVVWDPMDPPSMNSVGIQDVNTVVIALADDTMNLFTTLVIRERNPDIEIIARANESENVRKLYRAGADSVLSLVGVSSRLVVSELLDEDELRQLVTPIEIVRTTAPGLIGQTLAESRVRTRTGATVIAVQRDGEVLTGIEPSFTPEADDEFIVLGTKTAITQFEEL